MDKQIFLVRISFYEDFKISSSFLYYLTKLLADCKIYDLDLDLLDRSREVMGRIKGKDYVASFIFIYNMMAAKQVEWVSTKLYE